ncbi:MAG: OmpH family outer membrane protein [Bacteroidetes bacterium]|nr:OmpH family outer membrane protein [Bacteroidota bacterium]
MKKIIIALQVVILIAIGVLFYRSFSEKQTQVIVKPQPTTTVKLPVNLSNDDIVVYYDQDEVLEKSVFVKNMQKQAKNEMQKHGTAYEKEENEYAAWADMKKQMNDKGLLNQTELNKVLLEDQQWKSRLQEKGAAAEKAIADLEMKFITKVQDAIQQAVDILNKEKKVKYVMIQTKAAKIFHVTDQAMNITAQVIKAIDDLNK